MPSPDTAKAEIETVPEPAITTSAPEPQNVTKESNVSNPTH